MTSLLIEKQDGVTILTLNRPESLNAFTDGLHAELRAALEEARDEDTCRAVIITGAGRGFCAGQDLGERDPRKMQDSPDLSNTLEKLYNPLVRLIRDMPKPIICAVNGVAAGAGANVALNCDIVMAARSAKFIQAFAKIGLIPDSGGTWHLPRLVGEARAKALMMTAAPLMAEEAERIGMIYKCVDDDALRDEAISMATKFAAGPTFGLGLMKQAIHAASDNSLDEQLDLEAELQMRAGRSQDYAEGVTAFMEKRAPNFTGKE